MVDIQNMNHPGYPGLTIAMLKKDPLFLYGFEVEQGNT